jgi:hypothetical protein
VIRALFLMMAALALLGSLSACGKRAAVMEAPEGDDPSAYPRHYPDHNSDPPGSYVPPATP